MSNPPNCAEAAAMKATKKIDLMNAILKMFGACLQVDLDLKS